MTRIPLVLAAHALAAASLPCAADPVLWSRQPAPSWQAAMPLGNGRLGAMVLGGAPRERIQLNEESLWAGEPFDTYPDGFAEHLKTVQRLVLEGKLTEAQKYGLEHLAGQPTAFRSYQPLADLAIELEHPGDLHDYRRELDLRTGLARVQYRAGDVTYVREALISAPDDVLAIRLTSDKPRSLRGVVRLTREKDMRVAAAGRDRLHMDGQIIDVPAPEGYDDNPGGSGPGGPHMKLAGRLLARAAAGRIRAEGDHLAFEDADDVILLFTAATDFSLDAMNFDRAIHPGAVADRILQRAVDKAWPAILRDHIAEHQPLFDRVSLDLGGADRAAQPTDERLAALKKGGEDPQLAALSFQFGRYLLMSASRRPGRLPPNLQGLWSDRMWAAWEADYHLNINLQMNFWPAGVCNLSETVEPLVDWFERVTRKGEASAKKLYGADGWVAFTMVDLFGRTTPAGSTIPSQFENGTLDPLAGAWMATALWDHYTFTGDERFLRERAWPVLAGACAFLLDILVDDGHGQLVIVPSTSPENSYIDPTTRRRIRITQGSTYHMTVVREVFDIALRASKILDTAPELRERIAVARAKLPPLRIGGNGTIQEWYRDFEEAEPGHRHMSHLLGLYPFAQITPANPDLLAGARKMLERRIAHGGGSVGWSRAWMISLFARLLDAGEAHRHVVGLLQQSTHANFFTRESPWQVDCHLGGTAGIAEMLLQSHEGQVHLLPALPRAWPEGSVRGLVARGGFVVDMEWKCGSLTRARILSRNGGYCRIRCAEPVEVFSAGRRVESTDDSAVVAFTTSPGGVYELRRR